MTLSRGTQALLPLLLAPLVAIALDASGNDKVPVYIIPWLAFAAAYWLAFTLLAPRIRSTPVLTLTAFATAAVGGIALAMGVVFLLSGGRAF